jgi:hypothetical protein
VLDAGTFPAVRRLDASAQALTADAVRTLSGSPVMGQLEELRISGNRLGDDGALVLAEAGTPALRLLDLSHTDLTDRGALALADSGALPNLAVLILLNSRLAATTIERLRNRFPCVLVGAPTAQTLYPAFFEVWP